MRLLRVILFIASIALVWQANRVLAESDAKNGYIDPEMLEIASVSFAADPYSKANYDPFVKMNVVNNSSEMITRALIIVEIKSDDGRFTLFKDKFHAIPDGGLKPYSAAVWKFYPTGSSEMALKGLPRDAAITAYAEKVMCRKRNSPWFYEHKFNYNHRGNF